MSIMASSIGGASACANVDENAMDVSNQQDQMDDVTDGEIYKTDEASDNAGEDNSTKNCVLRMLDEMDRRVRH